MTIVVSRPARMRFIERPPSIRGGGLIAEEADIQVLTGRDDDRAAEPGQELGEGLEEEPLTERPGALAGLGQNLGEPGGLAAGRLDEPVEPAGRGVGDLAGLAAGLGLGAVAILLGPGDRLAAIAASPRGVGKRRGHGRGRDDPAQPDRHDRDPQALFDRPVPGFARVSPTATSARPVVSNSSMPRFASARVKAHSEMAASDRFEIGASGRGRRPDRERGTGRVPGR